MRFRPSKSDKKITNALTNEGKDRPHVKVAGQDCRVAKTRQVTTPSAKEGVVTNPEELPKLPVQTIAKIVVSNIWLGAHPGESPSVSAGRLCR